jgi:hypothetical protein
MKNYQKLFIGIIAICLLVVNTANTVEASLITKRIEGVKKIANLVSTWTWKNKGSIAVGTVATVALTNPEAVKAAVTGTADVAYGVVTGGKTANAVAPRANARPSTTGGSIIPTLLFYLAIFGLVFLGARYLLHRIGIWRLAVPLLLVGVLFCCAGTTEAAVVSLPNPLLMLATAPAPFWTFANVVLLAITIFI